MIIIWVAKMGIQPGVELNRDEPVLGQLRRINQTQIPSGTTQSLVTRRKEKRQPITKRTRIQVLDPEGESRVERGRGIRILIEKRNCVVVNHSTGTRRWYTKLLCEADNPVPEVRVAEEGKVAESEGMEIESHILRRSKKKSGFEEKGDEEQENKKLS
ncbi:hypothetical protein SLA2020_057960 [Shorea laevis]